MLPSMTEPMLRCPKCQTLQPESELMSICRWRGESEGWYSYRCHHCGATGGGRISPRMLERLERTDLEIREVAPPQELLEHEDPDARPIGVLDVARLWLRLRIGTGINRRRARHGRRGGV